MSTQPPPPSTPAVGFEAERSAADDPRRWGLGDAWIGLFASQLLVWLLVSIAFAVGDYDSFEELPLWLFGLINLPLHITLAVVAISAARTRGAGFVRDFGFSSKWSDIPNGLIAGVAMQFILVPLVTYPVIWLLDKDIDDVGKSARDLADRADTAVGVISLTIAVGLIAPVVEELFFRGLMLEGYLKRRNLRWLEALPARIRPDTSTTRWNTVVGVMLSSAIFSIIHFRLLLLPALFAVGMVFAVMKLRTGRLGLAIWAHISFNATTLASLLA